MPQPAFILILTADEERGQRLRELLHDRHSHSCRVSSTLDDALDSIRDRVPDVVVADAHVAGRPTAAPLAELLDSFARDATLLLLGDVGEDSNVPTATNIRIQVLSADEYGEIDDLVRTIAQAAARAAARREDRLLQKTLESAESEVFEGIVGVSPGIRRIVDRIRRAASRTKLTVLILGETGTGKELIASAIHNQSDRARKPFKAVNCAGLNENLLESELFGHVKGAFTGAHADRKGYFLAADGGTLFLDEIGDMPLTMQAKLLRALESREITPVGSTDVRKVDVRLIAATHQDLRALVQEGRFREDLYYRLNQWPIEVPPLRERRADIPLLAVWLLKRANARHGTDVPGFSGEAMTYLTKYLWPGNVRELSNVIERLAVEVENRRIEADDLPEEIRGSREIVPFMSGLVGLRMTDIEKRAIQLALQSTNGNRDQAAKLLGMGTRTLYRKIKEYNL